MSSKFLMVDIYVKCTFMTSYPPTRGSRASVSEFILWYVVTWVLVAQLSCIWAHFEAYQLEQFFWLISFIARTFFLDMIRYIWGCGRGEAEKIDQESSTTGTKSNIFISKTRQTLHVAHESPGRCPVALYCLVVYSRRRNRLHHLNIHGLTALIS